MVRANKVLARRWSLALSMAAGLFAAPTATHAASGTWTNLAGGVWSAPANWTASTIASGAGFTANLNTINLVTSNKTVSVDSDFTIGTLLIGDSNATDSRSYILNTTGGSLTFDNGASSAVLTQVGTSNGDTISVPLILNSSLAINNNDDNTMVVSGAISSTTAGIKTITLGGTGTGAITFSAAVTIPTGDIALVKNNTNAATLSAANTYASGTTVNAGTLIVSTTGILGANVVGNNIVVNSGASLRLAATTNFGANQTLTLNSSATGLAAFGVTFNSIPAFTNLRDVGVTTGGIFASNTSTFSTAVNLATLGGGGMFLGSITTGSYTAATLGADGTTYRLGGGGGTLTVTQGVLAGATDLVVGDTRTNGGGTVILSANHTYTGTTTVNGGTLVVGNAGTTGSISNNTISVGTGAAIAFNRTDNMTLTTSQPISGGGTLVAANGTLTPASDTQFTNLGLQFGLSNASGPVSTLDLTDYNASFNNLTVLTNHATLASVLKVGATKTVNIGGNVVIGGNTRTNFNVTGGGSLNFTNTTSGSLFLVGAAGTLTTADFSGAGSLNISLNTTDGVLRVNSPSSTNTVNIYSTMVLPTTGSGNTTLTANTLSVGDGAQNNSGVGQINALQLGSGLNDIRVNNINVGTGLRDLGSITFAGANGSLKVRNPLGGAATLSIGTVGTGTGGNTGAAGSEGNTFNVMGHDADLLLNALSIGTQNRGAALKNTFGWDKGTLEVLSLAASTRTANPTTGTPLPTTTTITIGSASSTLSDTAKFTNGITALATAIGGTGTGFTSIADLNIGGGTVTIGKTGNNSISMASANINTATTPVANIATATINITGGVTTLSGHIVHVGGTGGIATSTLNLNGGTLDMGMQRIGGTAAANNLTNLIFASGTLQNVADINNGAAISKTTAGMLVLAGNNTYAGATNVNAGTLRVNGKITSAVNVIAGTLDGTGNGTTTGLIGAAVLIGDGTGVADSILAPGNSIGTLTATGSLTFNTDGAFNVEIDTTSGLADKMVANGVTIGAGVNINFAELNPGVLGAGSFTLIDNTSATPFSAPFANLAEGGTVTLGANSFTATYLGGVGGNDLVLSVVAIPEPSTFVLGGLALLGLGGYRLRRRRQG